MAKEEDPNADKQQPLTPDEAPEENQDAPKGEDTDKDKDDNTTQDNENGDEAAPADGAKPKSKLKKILLIAVPLLILIIGGVLFFLFILKKPAEEAQQATHGDQLAEENLLPLEQNAYFDFDPITVALSSSGGKREFLRLDITLRVNSEADNKIILSKLPIIKDSLIVFLRSLRSADFNNSSSTYYLKQEIAKRVNKIVEPVEIKEILFQEITIN